MIIIISLNPFSSLVCPQCLIIHDPQYKTNLSAHLPVVARLKIAKPWCVKSRTVKGVGVTRLIAPIAGRNFIIAVNSLSPLIEVRIYIRGGLEC